MSQNTDMRPKLWTDYNDLALQDSVGALAAVDLAQASDVAEASDLAEATDVAMDGFSRRTFLSVMGASAAFAGVGLSGCIRKPVTKIVPYAKRPEELTEGVAMHFASAYQEGVDVYGIIVESHEGRPTKIEGNPAHRDSQGATNATTQGSVLGLYDLDRSTQPREAGAGGEGKNLAWDEAWSRIEKLAALGRAGTDAVAFVLPTVMSPTTRRLLTEAKASFPKARFFRSDVLYPDNAMAGAQAVGGPGAYTLAHLENADVIAAFDADFLGGEAGAVRATKGFSKKRRVSKPGDPMNRLYVAEANFSATGAMADHRFRVKAGDVGRMLGALAGMLAAQNVSIDSNLLGSLTQSATFDAKTTKGLQALAKDLATHRGQGVVLVGYRQPPWVHALALAINNAIGAHSGAVNATQTWHRDGGSLPVEGVVALAQAIDAKAVQTVFVLEANPAFSAPGALGLSASLKGVNLVHAGLHYDETAKLAALHVPVSHYLEAWGDLASLSGAVALQQPLIEPLHFTPSALEVLARIVTGKSINGYDLVRDTWKNHSAYSEKAWERWLFEGVAVSETVAPPETLKWADAAMMVAAGVAKKAATLEVGFTWDATILDGRHANNGWLRELPNPMSKLTWDNALLVNKATSQGLETGDLVKVTVGTTTATLPVHLMPGLADGVVMVAVGNGRRGVGKVADQNGFDAFPILPSDLTQGWFAEGSFAAIGDSIRMANVQRSGNSLTPRAVDGYGPPSSPKTYADGKGKQAFEPRLIALQATATEYEANPTFADTLADRSLKDEKVKSWMYPDRPNQMPLAGGATTDDVYLNGVHQWGMSIDLNACTGCNACTIACQAENNIVVIGKEEVLNGREMHWIRLDRYFSGSEDDIEAILQPLPCQQCETAPCEAVCPVKATVHSNEGLNDMAYNRCIGTRYCANNCPFKVRRFNWFNFNLDLHPLEQMQKNPDVTIRFRGVMEKCTYCIQRINRAKINAKIHGDGRVRDGEVITACQQVCPAEAITFGDLRDATSKVVATKSEPRTYQLLRELNLRARTTYLAKIRNPNPDLV